MPATHNPNYKRPKQFLSAHLETIYPALYRKVSIEKPERERVKTPDGDFLDLDWWKQANKRIVILQHGLEGSSDRPYILGMAKIFLQNNYDVLAWNFRSCSGEMNLTKRYYHSGATEDLDRVVQAVVPTYDDITLIGFSLGGNLTLKYLGEAERPAEIKRAVVISTPLDLASGADNLKTLKGFIYEKRFLRNLRKKVLEKSVHLPGDIDKSLLKMVKSLKDFDDYYTAPLHGFKDAEDYYNQCSSKHFLAGIKVPTLILNALNDPVLSRESFDHNLTRHLDKVYLETTDQGGHVGFILFDGDGFYWSEKRALLFCDEMQ